MDSVDILILAMDEWRIRPSRGECWESDRGIRAKVREVRDDSVVIELVEAQLGAFSMRRRVFELTFKHLASFEPEAPPDPSRRTN
jgi:hypothetical protein